MRIIRTPIKLFYQTPNTKLEPLNPRKSKNKSQYLRRHAGFTLIELMITLSIIGILFSAVLPSFRELTHSSRATLASRDIMTTLNYARGEAVAYQQDVVICPIDPTKNKCIRDWTQVLSVFKDDNSNQVLDEGEKVLQQFDFINNDALLMWRSFGNKPYLRYAADGTTVFQSGRLYYCSPSKIERHNVEVIIYRTGRARIVPSEFKKKKCIDTI